jgi:acetyl esterase/lipase
MGKTLVTAQIQRRQSGRISVPDAWHRRVRLWLRAGLATILAGCSTAQFVNAFIPAGGYSQIDGIAYSRNADPRQTLDVYVPREPTLPAPRPVVVFFYGGSWQSGDKAVYQFVGEALTAQGYVVVIPNYRTYPSVNFPAFVDDAAKSVRWTQDHVRDYGGDPANMVLMGHSAGAHIAMLLGLDAHFLDTAGVARTNIRAVIGMAGPYDFLPLTDPKLEALFTNADGLAVTQPINFVRGDEPPLLLLHGLSDTTVLPRNSEHLAVAARAAGAQVMLIEYPDYGHIGLIARVAAPLRGNAHVLPDITDYIRAHTTALTAHRGDQ